MLLDKLFELFILKMRQIEKVSKDIIPPEEINITTLSSLIVLLNKITAVIIKTHPKTCGEHIKIQISYNTKSPFHSSK